MTVTLDSIDELQGIFEEIETALSEKNYSDELEAFLPVLEEQHQDYFNNRSGPSGKWKDWQFRAPWSTNNHQTLEVSGRLRGSLRSGGQGHVENINISGSGFSELTWGTNVPYAGIHNDGATFTLGIPLVHRNGGWIAKGTKITIPQREFVGTQDKTVQSLCDEIADATVEVMKGKQ